MLGRRQRQMKWRRPLARGSRVAGWRSRLVPGAVFPRADFSPDIVVWQVGVTGVARVGGGGQASSGLGWDWDGARGPITEKNRVTKQMKGQSKRGGGAIHNPEPWAKEAPLGHDPLNQPRHAHPKAGIPQDLAQWCDQNVLPTQSWWSSAAQAEAQGAGRGGAVNPQQVLRPKGPTGELVVQ